MKSYTKKKNHQIDCKVTSAHVTQVLYEVVLT